MESSPKSETKEAWAERKDEYLGHLGNQEEHEVGFWEAIHQRPTVVGWCLYSVFTCLLVSFENQAAGLVLSIPRFRQDFGHKFGDDYVLDAAWQSAFFGGPIASTIIGTLTSGYMADRFGRKPMLIGALILSFAAIALEFSAETREMFFGGKLLNGFLLGIIMTTALTYLGEITPLALRGILTCLNALMFTLGPLSASIIVERTGSYDSRWAYRSVFVAQFAFSAIASVFVFFMPESPTWLLSIGRGERAAQSLKRLGYSEANIATRTAQIQNILEQAKQETEGATYLELFRGSNLRRTIISIMPLAIQALGGVFFISSYGTYYIQLAGYSVDDSYKMQIGQHGLSMAGNICSWYLVERVGRRPLTFWGQCSLTVILMVCAGFATEGSPGSIKGSVALIMIYNFFYNISIGATAYTLLVEVSTSRLRVKTISLGVAFQYLIYTIWAFVLPLVFNPDKANLGAKTAFIFGGLSVICLVYLWFYQVETAGRSYEELDELFMKGVKVREFKNYITTSQMKSQKAQRDHA
ncbi:maltose permease [Thozetella sp. PMI_491]|nr:maltose permease [Thozetella sp. PMI_491]